MLLKFNVKGMTCAACSARVEKVAGKIPGVLKAEVNLLGGKLTIDAETPDVSDAVIAAVNKAGYIASAEIGQTTEKKIESNSPK